MNAFMSEINAFISEMDAFTFGITAFISRWMHFRIAIPILELRSQSQNCDHNFPSCDPNPRIAVTIPQVVIPIPELRSQFPK